MGGGIDLTDLHWQHRKYKVAPFLGPALERVTSEFAIHLWHVTDMKCRMV